MALNSKTLQMDFYNIFEAMNNIHSNGDEYLASNCAKAIATYVSNGTVITTDVGTGSVTGSTYTGVGQGTMTINSEMLKNLLLTTFKLKSVNPILAFNIAMNIDSVCKVPNIIKTDTVGSSVIPPSSPYVDKGKGLGNFTSVSTLISTRLTSCFSQMNNMKKNGNLYLSQEWANAIDTYFKSAVINVTLQSPMIGNGVGKIT